VFTTQSLHITHTLKNYVHQVLNEAINCYNGALSTAYSRIAALEAGRSVADLASSSALSFLCMCK